MPKCSGWNKGRGKGYLWLSENSKIQTNDCVLWPFALDAYGYGTLGYGGIVRKAHRFSYELNRGPIVDDLHVCHTCDVRRCVNPRHLFLATNAENTADKMAKGRYGSGQGAPPGERHHKAKLTAEQVSAIKAAIGGKSLMRELAEQYGMSYNQIWKIRSGRQWTCLSQQQGEGRAK